MKDSSDFRQEFWVNKKIKQLNIGLIICLTLSVSLWGYVIWKVIN